MKLYMYLAACAACLLAVFRIVECLPVVIDTGDDLGKIQGSQTWAVAGLGQVGRRYYWFTGIPYAHPESYIGENRFKPPKVWNGTLPDEGNGTFYADERKSVIHCLQTPIIDLGITGENTTVDVSALSPSELLKAYYSREGAERRRNRKATDMWGREDCLVVTVSTPRLPRGEAMRLLPVIFFIHGGSFDAFWGSVFGGQRLLNHDVVLVSINYRLGILGTLNLGIVDAPGNAAVYDCIAALEWVQKYISHFGGDKNRVSITGQSAGAVLATTVFLSPLAKGLFHGVIGDSGSALSVWANENNPIVENLKIVRETECAKFAPGIGELPTDTQAQDIRNCMKDLEPHVLAKAKDSYSYKESLEARLGYDAVVPSVQKSTLIGKIPLVLTETPAEILKKKNQSNVPLMMGATRHDGSFVFVSTFENYLIGNGKDSDAAFIKNDLLSSFMKGVGLEDPTGALMHAFHKTFLGDSAHSDDIISKFPGLIDIHTVIGFKAGAYNLVEQHSKLNPNSYYYAFDYKGLFTIFNIGFGLTQVPGGVCHVDDLLYLFQLIPLLNEKDWAVSDRYVQYWVNFATYGNPNGPGNLDEPFPKYNPVDHRFLIINDTDRMGFHCRDSWIGNSYELFKR